MKERLLSIISLLTLLYFQGFTQLPPVINSYAIVAGYNNADLTINYTANDTGTVKIQVVLQQGTGNDVYDSTYNVSADSSSAVLYLGPIYPCAFFKALVNLSNAHAQSAVYNPLTQFSTNCTTGIPTFNENDFSIIALGHVIEL